MLLISETKLNDSFHTGQFVIDGFNATFRLDSSVEFYNSMAGRIYPLKLFQRINMAKISKIYLFR